MGTLPNHRPVKDVSSPEGPGKLWWDRGVFLSDDEVAGGACPAVIDVTGRSRILAYSPHFQLAPGVWRATALLHLSPDAAHRRIGVQFGADPDFATVELPLGVDGDHRAELTLTVIDETPLQVRLWLQKAAFHGEIRFAGVSFERVSDIPPASPAEVGQG
jgi:hypothetical protein